MIIENSRLALSASHRKEISEEHSEHREVWRGKNHADPQSFSTTSSSKVVISESAHLAFDGEKTESNTQSRPPSQTSPEKSGVATTTQPVRPPIVDNASTEIQSAIKAAEHDPATAMIRSMLKMLTGREVKVFSLADMPENSYMAQLVSGKGSVTVESLADQAAWGEVYQRRDTRQETESTTFLAEGTVLTGDGTSISFKLDLQMQSTIRQESQINRRSGVAMRDPLIVNFAGSAPQLLDQHFRFDLDGDGQQEELPRLGSGSGFLAFDKNSNGRVDSGLELFGPATDNGFAELAKLDTDGNGWIDSADPAFKQLGIWRPTVGEAEPVFQTLADAGIGALGLSRLATPMTMHGTGQASLGQVRESSVALSENGQALALQEIDLATRR